MENTLFPEGKAQEWCVVNGAPAPLRAVAFTDTAIACLGPAAAFALGPPFASKVSLSHHLLW